MNKYIFVSGGVCSSLGKGVAASSLGALLEGRGLNVCMVKCDPYINVDAGTMSPYQHGEAYVTDDGAETDLDLGNYARFTSAPLSQANSITTGQVYDAVIRKEREGRYLGRCVQVIPHITDEIKSRITTAAKESADTDIVIVEIGGTVGDIESIPFLEAARQMIHELGKSNAISVHLTLIPEVGRGELKTKPTQHSVKAMQEMGIQPDILICRASAMLDEANRKKIALFCNVENEAVFTCYNIESMIYEIPLMFFNQNLDLVVLRKLGVESRHANIKPWKSIIEHHKNQQGTVRIGIVGKYMELHDAYKSVYEALFHGSLDNGVKVELEKIDSSSLEDSAKTKSILDGYNLDGILVPGGGYGERGINGMVHASCWARENKVPYFGICLGMQVMVIDWGRNVLLWEDADSAEFNQDTKHPVISLLEDQDDIKNYGFTMRKGKCDSVAEPHTLIEAAYIKDAVSNKGLASPKSSTSEKDHPINLKFSERHRNRYEFSNVYRKDMIESGLKLTAFTPDKSLVDCIEWPEHPWGLGVMFHPEFKSKPTAAHPLFKDFIAAAKRKKV